MGEVYKARDTRLDRFVAIKILPETLAADPQFRERFDREARAISQLTHPNICTVYDVGEERGTLFLVMEYLEGETLAERLARTAGSEDPALQSIGRGRPSGRPISMDEAFTIAIQIASALDKAHRAGITHRDLKPGNIMLTKAGAKLLDFGLAKARDVGVAQDFSPAGGGPAVASRSKDLHYGDWNLPRDDGDCSSGGCCGGQTWRDHTRGSACHSQEGPAVVDFPKRSY